MNNTGAEHVLALVKTPLMARGTGSRLPATLTLAEALDRIKGMPLKGPDARVASQLSRETSGPHDYLALIKPTGETAKVPPTTTLAEIAIPREVRTSRGVEVLEVASFEVQSYASVGDGLW